MESDLAGLRGVEQELETLHDRCVQQFLTPDEARDSLGALNRKIRDLLPAGSDDFRVYDRYHKKCHGYWTVTHGYVDVKNCDNIVCVLNALRAVFTRHAPDFVAGDQPRKDSTYFVAGDAFQPRQMLINLMQHARQNLIFVDKYLDHDILNFLHAVDPAVSVRLMTALPKPPFTAQLPSFRQQRPSVEARLTTGTHDRFLVVDRTNIWHIGASLNGFGKEAFRISRETNASEQTRILADLDAKWTAGTPL